MFNRELPAGRADVLGIERQRRCPRRASISQKVIGCVACEAIGRTVPTLCWRRHLGQGKAQIGNASREAIMDSNGSGRRQFDLPELIDMQLL